MNPVPFVASLLRYRAGCAMYPSVCPVPLKMTSSFFGCRACTTYRQTRVVHGGRNRTQTCDFLGVNEAFYQLNYPPKPILLYYKYYATVTVLNPV